MKTAIDISAYIENEDLINNTLKQYNLIKSNNYTKYYQITGGYYQICYLNENNQSTIEVLKNKNKAYKLYNILKSFYTYVSIAKFDIKIDKYFWLIGSTEDDRIRAYLYYKLDNKTYDILIEDGKYNTLYWNNLNLITKQELNKLKKDLE